MPAKATVSDKYQVVIPKAIRQQFDFTPGTSVSFFVERNKLVLRTPSMVMKTLQEDFGGRGYWNDYLNKLEADNGNN